MDKSFVDEIIVFTDGSFSKKSGKILCGYGVYFPNGELPNISRPFKRGNKTNQRAELFAIYVALVLIKKNFNYNRIKIYTDSEYSIKSLTIWNKIWEENGWKTSNNKPVENTDLIKPIVDILNKQKGKVIFVHVRSHTGSTDSISLGNEKADQLAKQGANKLSTIT